MTSIFSTSSIQTIFGAFPTNHGIMISAKGSRSASLAIGGSSYIQADGSSGDVEVFEEMNMNDNDIVNIGNVEIDNGNFEITGDGFYNLARMSGTDASGAPGDQDGSMYYRTDDDIIRVKINGSWETVQTV